MDVNRKRADPRATLKGIAAELGVSPATVSNAYNRPDQLSPGLRARIFETARRLGYSGPDPAARSLRRRRAGAVGILYADRLSYAFADPAAVMFLEGVSRATEDAGLGMLLVPGSPRHDRDPAAVGEAVVDGFVVYCMAEDDPLVDAALERRLPAVLVDQPESRGVPSVGIDDEAAARTAAEHLISQGHRRLGVISFELTLDTRSGLADLRRRHATTYWPSRLRLQGYAAAIESAGLSWEETPVYECAENSQEEGAKAGRVLLSLASPPTALLVTSDRLSLGVLDAARKLGRSVPTDLSVVGFDDIPEAVRAAPPLTTVHQPHVEKGRRAGEILIAQLRGEEAPLPELLPTRLVVRGSTAPPAKVD